MKLWTDSVWDWLAIARTDRKSNNKGLENSVRIDLENKETEERCKWVCLELFENWFVNNKDAEMGLKIWFFRRIMRVEEHSIGSCEIYIDIQIQRYVLVWV